LRDGGIVAVDRSAIRYGLVRDPLRIRLEQAADSLVVLDRRERIVSRE
jgi:hypothetical protein